MDTQDQTIVQGGSHSSMNQARGITTSTPATFKQTKCLQDEENYEANVVKRSRNSFELEEDVHHLKRRVEHRWRSDAIIMAKHDEQLDTIKNQKALDCIVMTGVVIQNLTGTLEERKPRMFETITTILKSFMEDPPAPTYTNHLNAQFNTPRCVLEVCFGNVDLALKVEKLMLTKSRSAERPRSFLMS